MPSFELLEFLSLLLILIPFSFAYYLLKRRRDMIPLLPGAAFLVLSFLCTIVEAFAAPDEFNFFEHFFIMLAGISFILGMGYRYYKKLSIQQVPEVKHKNREGW